MSYLQGLLTGPFIPVAILQQQPSIRPMTSKQAKKEYKARQNIGMPSKKDAKEYFDNLTPQIKKDQDAEEKAHQKARRLDKERTRRALVKTRKEENETLRKKNGEPKKSKWAIDEPQRITKFFKTDVTGPKEIITISSDEE